MEQHKPLYHRNSAIVPGSLARLVVGLAILIGVGELVLAIASAV